MTAPITVGDEVAVRDGRQLCARRGAHLSPGPLPGPWYVVDVCGVAARIGLSPITPPEIAAVTPLSNLRRTEAAR